MKEKQREETKAIIPTCNIMGVDIAAIDMPWLVDYITTYMEDLKGDYVCVSNVHTTVTAYYDETYRDVQNGGIMAIPDGGPLSSVGRRRGYTNMQRTTGPSLLGELFKVKGLRHYFYGSRQNTLDEMEKHLKEKFPDIEIAGMYSPPWRDAEELTGEEDLDRINAAGADIIWVGLGAPKQEIWMNKHQNKVNGLMIGVGAGFNFWAGEINRAPKWMQEHNLEWLYRLLQDPKSLLSRYVKTNGRFIWHAMIRGK